MEKSPAPPSRTSTPASTPAAADDPNAKSTWSSKMKAKSKVWGTKAMEKGVVISDNLGTKVNDIAEKRFGTEAFWPVTGDFPKEIEKCTRILRAFTVEGVVTTEEVKVGEGEGGDGKKRTKQKKVLRKIPPAVMQQAKGVAIFTSMRTGIAPFGGAGGAGLVVAKLPDGTWSPPSSISPNNLSTGFLLGVDVYDCVLVIRSQKALDSFRTHKATLGLEIGVAAGPYGSGAAVEAGLEKAPVFSYVRSRGMYAGVELVGQVFVERYDENAAMYHYPGVKAGDILAGKVRVPREAEPLHQALRDAVTGKAQQMLGSDLDIVVPEGQSLEELHLGEGETLKLPPTPEMTDGTEHLSDPETERITRFASANSAKGKILPSTAPLLPPPRRGTPKTLAASTVVGDGEIGAGGRRLPPRPPSMPARPAMLERDSSTSNYSTNEEEGLPPAYGAGEKAQLEKDLQQLDIKAAGGDDATEYSTEPLHQSQHPAASHPSANAHHQDDGLSDAERREWEQYYADQQAAQGVQHDAADVVGHKHSEVQPPYEAHPTSTVPPTHQDEKRREDEGLL